jgi:phosphoribosylglycinamide formyltransferase 1
LQFNQQNNLMDKIKIALFASGTGSNVFNIIQHFKNHLVIEIVAVLSNKPDAGALNHGKNSNIDTFVFTKEQFVGKEVLDYLINKKVNYVILAGFLWKIPSNLLNAFSGKMINIHPSLLPKYGGKGMYGKHVHEAVVANKEPKTGITIHQVNEYYDEGNIVAQFETSLDEHDTPETVAAKISKLEKAHFPGVIEKFILSQQ